MSRISTERRRSHLPRQVRWSAKYRISPSVPPNRAGSGQKGIPQVRDCQPPQRPRAIVLGECASQESASCRPATPRASPGNDRLLRVLRRSQLAFSRFPLPKTKSLQHKGHEERRGHKRNFLVFCCPEPVSFVGFVYFRVARLFAVSHSSLRESFKELHYCTF